MLSQPGRTLVLTTQDEPEEMQRLQEAGAEVIPMPRQGNSVDLHAVLDHLGSMDINEVMLEMGATLGGAMLQAGLIDEMVFYVAPVLMGYEARGLFRLPGLETMDQRIHLDIVDQRMVGKDWRITAKVKG